MQITRRSVLAGLGGAATLALIPGPGNSLRARAAGVEFDIVVDGQAVAVIKLPSGMGGQTQRIRVLVSAANLLRDVVAAATGAELRTIYSEVPSTWTELPIYLDAVGLHTTPGFSNAGLGPDAFAVDINADAMTILGGTYNGTMVGVTALAESECGAEFLMPGPHGTKVTTSSSLTVDTSFSEASGTPDFTNRRIYAYGTVADGASSDPNNVFGSRLRLMNRAKYSHNLGVIFDPAKYAETHPEIYPVINGVRRIPSNNANVNWNPRWQDPITIAPAVEYAVTELGLPESTGWVALGINDNGGYSDDTLALGTRDADGMFSLSNVYCTWLNAVAEGVEAALGHQDFRLGFLAYNDIRSAPEFDLHPTLVPFITRDLYGWVSPELEAHDRALLAGWDARCVELGWWDYPWGSPIMVPRLFHRTQQLALKTLHDSGVRHVFAEMEQNSGEGAKAPLYAKMLWDVDLDVDAARDAWCEATAGPAGAAHLRAYDEHWNTWWATKGVDTEYVRSGKGSSYLWYLDTGYLNQVSDEDIETSRAHLDAAAAAAQTEDEAARLLILTRQHEYYRASVLSYDRDVVDPTSVREARDLFQAAISSLDEKMALAARRKELIAEFATDPVMRHRFEGPAMGLAWNGWPLKPLWSVAQYIIAQGSKAAAVLQQVRNTAMRHPSEQVRRYAETLLAVAEGRTVNRAVNPDFATGEIAPWQVDTASGWLGGEPEVTTEFLRNSPGSVRIVGPTAGGALQQTVTVSPGYLRASFWVRTRDVPNVIGLVVPTWLVFDAAGVRTLLRGEVLALSSTTDGWTECAMAHVLPEGTATAGIYLSNLKVASQTEMFITDITFTQVA
ncbi:DUF4838 domain-containing protein [Propionibacteriaceae bacterium Y2011]